MTSSSQITDPGLYTTTDHTSAIPPTQHPSWFTLKFPAMPGTVQPPFVVGFDPLRVELDNLKHELVKLTTRLTTLEIEKEFFAEELRRTRLQLDSLMKVSPQPFDRILKDITEQEHST